MSITVILLGESGCGRLCRLEAWGWESEDATGLLRLRAIAVSSAPDQQTTTFGYPQFVFIAGRWCVANGVNVDICRRLPAATLRIVASGRQPISGPGRDIDNHSSMRGRCLLLGSAQPGDIASHRCVESRHVGSRHQGFVSGTDEIQEPCGSSEPAGAIVHGITMAMQTASGQRTSLPASARMICATACANGAARGTVTDGEPRGVSRCLNPGA